MKVALFTEQSGAKKVEDMRDTTAVNCSQREGKLTEWANANIDIEKICCNHHLAAFHYSANLQHLEETLQM